MKKHRKLKRLTINRETVLHLTGREAAGGATDTCFDTCPVSCMVSCLDYITCRCPDTNAECVTVAPQC